MYSIPKKFTEDNLTAIKNEINRLIEETIIKEGKLVSGVVALLKVNKNSAAANYLNKHSAEGDVQNLINLQSTSLSSYNEVVEESSLEKFREENVAAFCKWQEHLFNEFVSAYEQHQVHQRVLRYLEDEVQVNGSKQIPTVESMNIGVEKINGLEVKLQYSAKPYCYYNHPMWYQEMRSLTEEVGAYNGMVCFGMFMSVGAVCLSFVGSGIIWAPILITVCIIALSLISFGCIDLYHAKKTDEINQKTFGSDLSEEINAECAKQPGKDDLNWTIRNYRKSNSVPAGRQNPDPERQPLLSEGSGVSYSSPTSASDALMGRENTKQEVRMPPAASSSLNPTFSS